MIPKINSSHGSETRNIINAAIDAINVQGKSIQDLVAEGQLTPTQYATLIQAVNGLISKGNVTIFDIDKNKGLFDSTFFTSDFLEELNNGELSVTEVLPRSITTEKMADKSVTLEKTDFLVVSSDNLMNKKDYIPNSWIIDRGTIAAYPSGHLLNSIPVKPGVTYTIFGAISIAYFDINRNFINVVRVDLNQTLTVPSDAYYLRPTVFVTRLETAQLNEGGALLPYDEYSVELLNRKQIELNQFSEEVSTGLASLLNAMTDENEEWTV